MKQKKVTNDRDRVAFLRQVVTTAQRDAARGVVYLAEGQLQEAAVLADELDQARAASQVAKTTLREAQFQRRQTIETLRDELRSYWEAGRWLVRRHGYSELAYPYYGLERAGAAPAVRTQRQVVKQAQQTIEQATLLAAQPYEAPAQPTAALLQAKLDAALAALAEVEAAQMGLNEKRVAIKAARQTVAHAISDILKQLHFELRQLEPVERRHILRTYGVQYQADYEKVPATVEDAGSGSPAPELGLESAAPPELETSAALSDSAVLDVIHQEGELGETKAPEAEGEAAGG